MASPRFSSIEDYLASLETTKAGTLRSVIDLILQSFPELEATISWNVPQLHRTGQYVFGVSASKSHLALAPWSSGVIEDFRARLEGEGYVVGKNLFQIPIDWEVDSELVSDLVRARLVELDSDPTV
jgi:uncharacterized protein YdhG (YjbR/CyaY superfamily)